MKTPMWLVALALMTVAPPSIAHAKPVTTEDLVKAQENAGEWLTYGRDYRNWRYSPLAEITPTTPRNSLTPSRLPPDLIALIASRAYDAKSGKELWKFQTGSGINASPITYELDGKQYVAILSGLGGDPTFYYSAPKGGMLWVFAIEGKVDEGDLYNTQVIREDAAEAIIMKRAAVVPHRSARARFILRLAALLFGFSPPAVVNAEAVPDQSFPRPTRGHLGRLSRYLSKQMPGLSSQRRRPRTEHLRDKTQRSSIRRNGDPRSERDANAGFWSSTVSRRD